MESNKETIKKLYEDMLEVAKINHPDVYLMPITYYNSISKRIISLERDLKRVKLSRDKYKSELKACKDTITSSHNDKAKLGGNLE